MPPVTSSNKNQQTSLPPYALLPLNPDIMNSSCETPGNSDMYGIGIRLGYYLQWFGSILAAWIAQGEVNSLRLTNLFFVTATFMALLIQVARGHSSRDGGLEAPEIYIILLMTFGSSWSLVPILLWRFLTCFEPSRDLTRWPKAEPASKVTNILYTTLLLAVLSFQIWFWSNRISDGSSTGCPSYGFLFSRVQLQQPALRWLNVTLSVILLGSLLALYVVHIVNPGKLLQREALLRAFKPTP
jgi:hypothetical protein